MSKLDPAVKKETGFIALGTLVLEIIMNIVFFLVSKFTDICEYDHTVILGSLLGFAVVVLNFFLMALTVQKAVSLDSVQAKKKMQTSYMLRNLLMIVCAGAGVLLPFFHWLPVLVSLIFPRIVLAVRSIFIKKEEGGKVG